MKTLLKPFLAFASFAAAFPSISSAAVIQTPGLISVEGFLDGDGSDLSVKGDTLDYLKFEVLTTTSITVTSGFNSAYRLMLAQFLGNDDEFGFIGNPYYLEQIPNAERTSFTRILDPGVYVTVIGMLEDTSYDIFDGFTAVNPEGGGFTRGNYSYSIAGDVRALEFWDGELDGTFKITTYDAPEPSTAFLALTATLVVDVRRRRALGQGLVKGWPCGGGGLRGPAF